MEENENDPDCTFCRKDFEKKKRKLEMEKQQKEFYKKEWKSRIIFLVIGIIIMILTLIIIASKY